MKLVLVAFNAKYVHSNLAIYDLEAYAKKMILSDKLQGVEIVVREFTINHNLDFILQELYKEDGDFYGFSTYIWNVAETLIVAGNLAKILDKAHIWLGGPEASYGSRDYLRENPFLEGIIVGEGEITLYELIKVWREVYFAVREEERDEEIGVDKAEIERPGGDIDREALVEKYKDLLGISYRDGEEIRTNAGQRLMDLDELPFIYYDLGRFENKIIYYESSRGCPFSCSYCLSSIDKKVRFRSFELVRRDLDFFLEKRINQVKFVDRTFNCKREHSLKIWKYILENDNGITNFHFEVAADLIGDEELAIFEKMRPGLIQLEIGLQSTNERTIREIRRAMDIDKVRRTLLKIRSFNNIHQHLDLIAGLPYEDLETFKRSFNEAFLMRPNQLQLGFLKVLKGSYMGEQVDNYKIEFTHEQPYEVLKTKWISYGDILELKKVEEMLEVYFNSNQFESVLPYLMEFFKDAYRFFKCLGDYYERNELFGIGFKREKRYVVLKDFCREYFGLGKDFSGEAAGLDFDWDIFIELLTIDLYLRENLKNRPDWIKADKLDKKYYSYFYRNEGEGLLDIKNENGEYDSKKAAKLSHIEILSRKTIEWLRENEDRAWDFSGIDLSKESFCMVFDYENRNILTRDAGVGFHTFFTL